MTFLRSLLCSLALVASSMPVLAAEGKIQHCEPGPWGRIEYQTIFLEAPDWIVEKFPLPNPQPRWSFGNTDRDAVREFLIKADIAPATVERWLDDPRSAVIEGSLAIFPSVEDIEGLSSMTRSIVYPELAKLPVNEFYNQPVFVTGKSVEEWLAGAELPAPIVELISKLCYLDGDALLFSDLATLMSHAESEAQARSWLKATTRTRAVLAYLRIGPDDDVAALSAYWSSGQRRKDVVPMLQSIAETPDGDRVDLTHLLPSQARKLIYTYPSPDAGLWGQMPNCHWTSLNFFNYIPQNVYLDLKLAATGVLSRYKKVPEPEMLGDVLFFLDANGMAYHSCVYIADKLVFTKNGDNIVAPWILTSLDDVKQVYMRRPGAKIVVYRQQDPSETVPFSTNGRASHKRRPGSS